MPEPQPPDDADAALQRSVLALVETCVRNTRLEVLHAGVEVDTATGDFTDVRVVTPTRELTWPEVSKIPQAEMKALLREIVDRVYTFLNYPEHLQRLNAAAQWDRPRFDPFLMATVQRRQALADGADPAQVWADHPIAQPSPALLAPSDTPGPEDLLALARAPVADTSWIARAREVMEAAAEAWSQDRKTP